MLYFAYGSNLHPLRLKARVPSAEFSGTGVLKGRRLAIHKRSWKDGSGKCDVPEAGSFEQVHGALFQISAADRSTLAGIEGVGKGYEELAVRIESACGAVDAYLFRAQTDFIDPTLRPFDWYKALVLAGAVFHRFPEDYVAAIESVPSIVDPDEDRALENLATVKMINPGAS